ncbi:MAG: hypothetical protein IPJ30_08955 [Acidobacteria bacterium]|nr:hypothetical protein [Acidobacteriota bacterium]
MARTIRANAVVGLENVALLARTRYFLHSSAERIVLPDSSAALDYILAKTTSLLGYAHRLSGKYAQELEPDTGLGVQRTALPP